MRIALIKTSSMGDVIHASPVVSDIVEALPDARIDWVVEEGFADLPRLHPAVTEVVPVALRRWRHALGRGDTWSEIGAARSRLREARYDLALDLQGLLKSAWIARWTAAPVAGFDRASAREPLAAFAYAKRYAVAKEMHAIERLRSLAAQALSYRPEGGPRFGLVPPAIRLPWLAASRYVVLLHASSRAEKLWPVRDWIALGRRLRAQGLSVVLPWGSASEYEAACALAQGIGEATDAASVEPCAIVAPRISLHECARLLADARGVVGVDTGLTHLGAALECPTVALFAATAAWRYGPYWTPRALSLGDHGVWPSADEVFDALDRLGTLARVAEPRGGGGGGSEGTAGGTAGGTTSGTAGGSAEAKGRAG